MELLLKRTIFNSKNTIGDLSINKTFFCNTLEDVDRGLTSSMSLEEIKRIKIPKETCIPTGKYEIDMNRVSPKFSKRALYNFCEGKVPYLKNVKGYEGVLIHIGNTDKDTEGCILVGVKLGDMVTTSVDTFKKLYSIMKEAANKGEKITITIE